MSVPLKLDYYTRTLGEASNTALKEFREYPLKYYDWCTGPQKPETPPMHEGKAVHMALHEPELFAKRYVIVPSMPLRSEQDKLDFWDACGLDAYDIIFDLKKTSADRVREMVSEQYRKRGSEILEADSLATLRAMVASLNLPCHRLARGIASRGLKEHELRWIDPDSGVQCKARIDSWDEQNGVESDLKRTTEVTYRAFRRTVYNYSYHYQRAFYRRGLRANGADPKYQCFVAGSPERPYPWAVYDVPVEILDECDAQISRDLLSLAECLAKNEWPTINGGEARTLDMNGL
jgi:hypothetical protein